MYLHDFKAKIYTWPLYALQWIHRAVETMWSTGCTVLNGFIFRWMRGLDKPSQVMISLIGQEWLPIRLIAATTHHAIAAQQGTSSVWHAAHDYSCWRGGSACCQGLFWGQPANRGAFLITVRDLETVLTLWARKPLDQETNVPDLWQSVDQNDWRDVCVIYVLLLETLKAHM